MTAAARRADHSVTDLVRENRKRKPIPIESRGRTYRPDVQGLVIFETAVPRENTARHVGERRHEMDASSPLPGRRVACPACWPNAAKV